ncbi:MAG: arylamine N-acetyltransferase [Planctomycetes bacterium]|nr:arylamine N-acetyltransferase [Planctomycetota bacterium]
MNDASVDLAAYFQRIGYAGRGTATLQTLRDIQFAHACSIPFENLDVLLKRGIALDLPSLQHKLVTSSRGGYCFEQNWLLLHVLRQLGFAATPLAARVRFRQPRDFVPPRTHIFVRVDLDGEQWLADVGVGGLSPTAPIRLVIDEEQPSPHEPRRILRENNRFYHQVKLGPDWEDVCEFTGEEMYAIDREVGNWWTSTNPNSKFAQNIMAAVANADGTRHVLQNQEYAHRRAADGHVLENRIIRTPAELLNLLADRFKLRLPPETRFNIFDL